MHLRLGDRRLDVSRRALVMGILNRTPDSFYDKGAYFDMDDFWRKAEQLVADGADILDVGGESTRPGHSPVDLDEERRRVLPVIEGLRAVLPETP
ncbi:MAG TPA: dihydropteroate synthase, partial [Acidimicrobiales bacterium]|nr:dihydropteroate synthase [Acidimicrobiales bacterium]